MNGLAVVFACFTPLYIAVWSCLRAAGRDDVDLVVQEQDWLNGDKP